MTSDNSAGNGCCPCNPVGQASKQQANTTPLPEQSAHVVQQANTTTSTCLLSSQHMKCADPESRLCKALPMCVEHCHVWTTTQLPPHCHSRSPKCMEAHLAFNAWGCPRCRNKHQHEDRSHCSLLASCHSRCPEKRQAAASQPLSLQHRLELPTRSSSGTKEGTIFECVTFGCWQSEAEWCHGSGTGSWSYLIPQC